MNHEIGYVFQMGKILSASSISANGNAHSNLSPKQIIVDGFQGSGPVHDGCQIAAYPSALDGSCQNDSVGVDQIFIDFGHIVLYDAFFVFKTVVAMHARPDGLGLASEHHTVKSVLLKAVQSVFQDMFCSVVSRASANTKDFHEK